MDKEKLLRTLDLMERNAYASAEYFRANEKMCKRLLTTASTLHTVIEMINSPEYLEDMYNIYKEVSER